MPQSYSALWVHLIWSTKNRESLLTPDFIKEVFAIINIIAEEHEIHIDCMNGVEDHLHLLVRLRTDQAVADVVKTLKGNSWNHFKQFDDKYLAWQDGFAAITVSPGVLKRVRGYIYNQQLHHRNKSLSNELAEIKAEIREHQ